jgi:hypothetical protein
MDDEESQCEERLDVVAENERRRNASLGSAVGDSSAQSRVTWVPPKNIGAPWRGTTSHSSYSRTTQRHYADTLRSNGNTRILQNKSKSRRRPVQNPPSLSHSHSPVFMSCAKAPPLATNSSKDPSSATLPSPRQMTRSHRLIASTECVMNTVVRVYDMSAANSRQRVSPR